MLALHYWLLFILDARLLFAVFRRWRDMNTTVVVCDKKGGRGGCSNGDDDQVENDAEEGGAQIV